jgi:hypothetical protein
MGFVVSGTLVERVQKRFHGDVTSSKVDSLLQTLKLEGTSLTTLEEINQRLLCVSVPSTK